MQQTVQTSSKKLTSNNQFTSLFLAVAFHMYVHNFFAVAQHFHILKTIFPPNKQTTLWSDATFTTNAAQLKFQHYCMQAYQH